MLIDVNYGPRVRAARAYAGLEQADVAAALDISVSTVARMEAGQRTLRLPEAHMLARVCDVPLAFLLYGWDVFTTPTEPEHRPPRGPQGQLGRSIEADRTSREDPPQRRNHQAEEG